MLSLNKSRAKEVSVIGTKSIDLKACLMQGNYASYILEARNFHQDKIQMDQQKPERFCYY